MGSASDVIERHLRLWEFLPVSGDGCDRAALETWGLAHSVTYRQIQRDLTSLESQKCVRSILHGKAKHWLRTPFRPGACSLSREQAFVLHAVRNQFGHLLPQQVLHMLLPLYEEAAVLLQRPEYKTERAWFEKIRVVPSFLQAPLVLAGVFPVIVEALLEEKWLQIDYENYAHQEMRGRLMPLGLVEQEQIYYLICRFDGYNDTRHIRVDRIIQVDKQDDAFRYPSDFSLQQYIDSGAFEYGSDELIQLRMYMYCGAHRHLIDRPLSRDQQLSGTDKKDQVLVQATVRSSERLRWWILGFGSFVEVIEPQNLRTELIEEVDAMQQRYEHR